MANSDNYYGEVALRGCKETESLVNREGNIQRSSHQEKQKKNGPSRDKEQNYCKVVSFLVLYPR